MNIAVKVIYDTGGEYRDTSFAFLKLDNKDVDKLLHLRAAAMFAIQTLIDGTQFPDVPNVGIEAPFPAGVQLCGWDETVSFIEDEEEPWTELPDGYEPGRTTRTDAVRFVIYKDGSMYLRLSAHYSSDEFECGLPLAMLKHVKARIETEAA